MMCYKGKAKQKKPQESQNKTSSTCEANRLQIVGSELRTLKKLKNKDGTFPKLCTAYKYGQSEMKTDKKRILAPVTKDIRTKAKAH